jgi:hypothetical protein
MNYFQSVMKWGKKINDAFQLEICVSDPHFFIRFQ